MSRQRENGYDIRPARAGDFPAVVGLSKLWAAEGCTTGYPGLKEGDELLGSWLDGGYFLVAEHEELIIAYAAGAVKEHTLFKPEGERFLHIHEVFVHLDHREKGSWRPAGRGVAVEVESGGDQALHGGVEQRGLVAHLPVLRALWLRDVLHSDVHLAVSPEDCTLIADRICRP